MTDQAAKLRTAVGGPARLSAIAVTGGKGGVGKTCLAVNLAVALAKLGQPTVLVDGDLGMANADMLLGLSPERTLADVLAGTCSISDVLLHSPYGVSLVPAASGVDELTRLSPERMERMIGLLASLTRPGTPLVIDTAAGIGREVLAILKAVRVILVVVTPDPTSMTDAYALIKVMEQQHPGSDLRLVINLADGEQEARQVATRLQSVARTHLKRELPLAGWIPRDPALADSVRRRKPLAAGATLGPAAATIRNLAVRLRGEPW